MSFRRRLLRLVVVVLVVILFVGFFSFTTFLYNPFEGDYEFDVSTLIPRDVDFYLSKADLEDDFDPFPRPEFAEEFEASKGGKAVRATRMYQELMGGLDLEPILARLDESLAQMPVDASPLSLFGGDDLAIAGYFQGRDFAESRWAIYGRTSWIGKLAVELLEYPDTIGLTEQGVLVSDLTNDADEKIGYSLSGGSLTTPLYLTRVLDVAVLSNTPDLVRQAVGFDAIRGQDSLGQSAKYGDHIDVRDREGDELEIYVDHRKLAENMGWDGEWPNVHSESPVEALFGRMFRLKPITELIARCSFGESFALHAHGQIASDQLTKEQKRLYRERPFNKERARDVARMVPADCGLFFYLHADLGDLLRFYLESLGDDTLGLLENQVRDVWGYPDAMPLIDDFDTTFHDRVAFVVRRNDYPAETKPPPHDDVPVLAWAVILWPRDPEKLAGLASTIRNNQAAFGIRGEEQGSLGVFTNQIKATGSTVYEYWNQLIPGTGMIATLETVSGKGGEKCFVISNTHLLLGDIDETFYHPGPEHPQLAEQNYFQTWVNAGLRSGNALLWLNPREVGETAREIARMQADLAVKEGIDWEVRGPAIERQILREKWPNVDPEAVPAEIREQLTIIYDQEAKRIEEEYVAENAFATREDYLRRVDALEIIGHALLELSIDPKKLDVMLRVSFPFD